LVIGISRYADPGTPALPGARIDKQSATQMAQAMQVPLANIRYLQDEQATGAAIRQALQELTDRVQEGDRVFIHYSGHGTRYKDPAAGGCVEALLAYDGGIAGTITNREMAEMLKTITNKTDKLFVMYDACHSGGVVQAAASVRTRGFRTDNDEGLLRPKFANISEECSRPVNIRTRSLLEAAADKGALAQDIIHVSASRDNEISFDDELKGGLATQYMRDCMLRDARDLDGSGAISVDEIRQCAQEKINRRMARDDTYKPHNLVVNGNAAFVPAWFAQPAPVAVSATEGPAAPAVPSVSSVPSPAVSEPVAPPLPALTGEQALRQLFEQRDAKRQVRLSMAKDRLAIGQDVFELSVQSQRAGYVYLALAGSDNQSVYLLFPNEIDQNNTIEANQTLALPRPSWRMKASGPEGTDNLLVLVTDAPRDLSPLSVSKAGPFVTSLNNAHGRAELGALLTSGKDTSGMQCTNRAAPARSAMCSDAFGAAMAAIHEFEP
jgi:hypothetical protein